MTRKALLGLGVALAFLTLAPLATPVPAQAQTLGSGSRSGVVTLQARVTSIDRARRLVTLVGPNGHTLTVRAGDEVRNFAQIRRGDVVTARYYESVGYVLSGRATTLPPSSVTLGGARAPEGAKPAGIVGRHVTLNGVVTGVDLARNELSLVDPSGGPVHTIHVMDPRFQARLHRVHVGDTLTIVLTQALAIALTPKAKD